MNANSFGLLNSLAGILNSQRRDSDYAIARYLVSRMDDLAGVSICDIIDNAYVTRSAVRRFCNRTGYSSFSDFKRHVTAAAYPSDLNHRTLACDLGTYRAKLDAGIAGMFAELGRAVTDETVHSFAAALRAHDRVVLVCANNTSGVLERFQQELLYARKLVQLVTDTYEERLAETCSDADTLMVVVSASGVFANSSSALTDHLPATRQLVTANADPALAARFEKTYCLSSQPISHDRLGLFGKYGVAYFFDLASACYLGEFAER